MRMIKRVFTAITAITLIAGGPAYALDMGALSGAVMKAWGKKDAIIKGTKALRKGFSELTGEEEYYIGRAVAAKILSDYKPVNDKKKTEYINTLGQVLARYSTKPETFAGYHFLLIKSDQTNAFAAPGGFIFITTGLYSKVKTEEQLAAVLAHEIAHVTLQHGLGAIKSSRLTEAFTILGSEVAKEYSPADLSALTSVFEGAIDDIVNKIVVSGYSRSQEYDADEEAIKITYKAGYNPAGLAEFLDILAEMKKGKKKSLGFAKTHPPAKERLAKVKKALSDGNLTGEDSATRGKRFIKFSLSIR